MGEHHRVHEPEPARGPDREQDRARREELGHGEHGADGGRGEREVRVEPVDEQALEDEAARERIQREERGDPVDQAARGEARGASRRPPHGRVRQPRVEERLDAARAGEEPEEHAEIALTSAVRGLAARAERGDREGAQARGDVAHEVVEAHAEREVAAVGGPRDQDLLDRQERPGLAGADGHVAQHGRQDDQGGRARGREERPRHHDEPRQRDEDRAASEALGGAPDQDGEEGAGRRA